MAITKPCFICGTPITRPASKFWTETPTCSKRCQFAKQRTATGERSPSWKGGKGTVNALGYVVVNRQGRVYAMHRLVMEAHIGRPLAKGEVVHHKNGIKSDNRIENLELCQTQTQHIALAHSRKGISKRTTCRYCDRKEWAKGLCKSHYTRARRGASMDQPIRHRS